MEVQVPDLSEAEQTAMTMVMVGAMMRTMLSVPVWSGDQASFSQLFDRAMQKCTAVK